MLERFGTLACLLASCLIGARLWIDPAALIWFEKVFISLTLFYATLAMYQQDVDRDLKRARATRRRTEALPKAERP